MFLQLLKHNLTPITSFCISQDNFTSDNINQTQTVDRRCKIHGVTECMYILLTISSTNFKWAGNWWNSHKCELGATGFTALCQPMNIVMFAATVKRISNTEIIMAYLRER